MQVPCRIEMFGGLRVWQADTLHTRFRTQKAASLLAYLALHLHQSQPRERLLDLFWANRPIEVGRDNLSTTLAQLRRQLEPVGVAAGSVIQADRQQVWLHSETVTTDVADFDRLVRDAGRCEPKEERAAILHQAVELYRGDLLPSHYEEWALLEQSRCRQVYLQSLHQLERLEEERGRYEAALVLAQRALQVDAYQEEACQAQMRLYVRLKRPSKALEVYEEAVKRFQNELGVLPSQRTRRMAEQIRQDPNAALMLREPASSPAPGVPPSDAASHGVAPSSAPLAPSQPSSPIPALPQPLTRFFGRRQELERLEAMLQELGVRLVTVLGPGGAGKTRLSIETAHRLSSPLQGRVWWVSLAELPNAGLLPSALLHGLHLSPLAQTDPLEQVAAALGGAPCLLVLDNFEHLLREDGVGKNETLSRGSAALVRMLLERAPHLRCLITSRQALRLGGEQEYALPPLALPEQGPSASLEALLTNESVALYVDRARQALPDFALTASNAASVIALCRKLEGMPLAIEMAAAWSKSLPPAKILERLERQLDLLVSRRRDLPPRHQSLRATVEWSYDLLGKELQHSFAQMAVFRGGWGLEAAEAVVGTEALELLVELQERSLIRMEEQEDEPRYRMLETLREFGQERLREQGARDAVRVLHIQYYANLAQEAYAHLHRLEEKPWMDRLALEYENLREALSACQDLPEQSERGIQLAIHLSWFWLQRGLSAEGRNWLKVTLERCSPAPTDLRARLLDAAAMLQHAHGNFAAARTLLQEAADICRHLGDLKGLTARSGNLATTAYDLGDIAFARRCWEENLQIAREQGWMRVVSSTLSSLGELAYDAGDLERARPLLEEAVQVRRPLGDRNFLGRDLGILGKIACRQGDLVQAEACFAECLELRRSMEDRGGMIEALEGIAGLARMQGDAERAVSLLACTDRERSQDQTPLPPNEAAEIAQYLESLRAMLDGAAFEAAWQQGQTWTLEQACNQALK